MEKDSTRRQLKHNWKISSATIEKQWFHVIVVVALFFYKIHYYRHIKRYFLPKLFSFGFNRLFGHMLHGTRRANNGSVIIEHKQQTTKRLANHLLEIIQPCQSGSITPNSMNLLSTEEANIYGCCPDFTGKNNFSLFPHFNK